MKLTNATLKRLIKEELRRRLHELHPGSEVGSYMKQGITKLWEADNFFQRALQEAETDSEISVIKEIHSATERLAFSVDSKSQSIISGDVNRAKKKAPPPPPRKPVK